MCEILPVPSLIECYMYGSWIGVICLFILLAVQLQGSKEVWMEASLTDVLCESCKWAEVLYVFCIQSLSIFCYTCMLAFPTDMVCWVAWFHVWDATLHLVFSKCQLSGLFCLAWFGVKLRVMVIMFIVRRSMLKGLFEEGSCEVYYYIFEPLCIVYF